MTLGSGCWIAKRCVFSRKMAAAGDERQLVCEALAATVVSRSDWFLQGVLQRAVVRLCAVTGSFGIFSCRSQCSLSQALSGIAEKKLNDILEEMR